MPITNQAEWDKWVASNTDPYGKACVDVAREVMNILDRGKSFDPHQIVCDADNAVKAGGITGFMAGAVAQMVSTCHSRGNEFKKAWNHQYDKENERDGVINPAIIEFGET
jgi:hypothetical protein